MGLFKRKKKEEEVVDNRTKIEKSFEEKDASALTILSFYTVYKMQGIEKRKAYEKANKVFREIKQKYEDSEDKQKALNEINKNEHIFKLNTTT